MWEEREREKEGKRGDLTEIAWRRLLKGWLRPKGLFKVLPAKVRHGWWFKSVLLPKSQHGDRVQLAKYAWFHFNGPCIPVFLAVLCFQVKVGIQTPGEVAAAPQVCRERKRSALKIGTRSPLDKFMQLTVPHVLCRKGGGWTAMWYFCIRFHCCCLQNSLNLAYCCF